MNTAEPFPLWPGRDLGLPLDVMPPTLTVYPAAPEAATGAAMIICPGGGYYMHADHEGAPVAERLASWGITAFVLRYRVNPHARHPGPLDDAAEALRVVRVRSAEWGIDTDRVGILGFSAGGHLASTAATLLEGAARPNLAVLIYPVIALDGPFAYRAGDVLLGEEADPAQLAALSTEQHVVEDTPPMFLVHTTDDTGVPVENSLLMAMALSAQKVPFELHVFPKGGHGYGMAEDDPSVGAWPRLLEQWLRGQGYARQIV